MAKNKSPEEVIAAAGAAPKGAHDLLPPASPRLAPLLARKPKEKRSRLPPPITPVHGSYRSTSPRELGKPDMDLWPYMGEVDLWQAVALLADIDPDSLELGFLEKDPFKFRNETPDFRRLVLIALSCRTEIERVAGGSLPGKVTLSKFFRWWADSKKPNAEVAEKWAALLEEPRGNPFPASSAGQASRTAASESSSEFIPGWDAMCAAIEARGWKLGKKDDKENRRRTATRLLRRHGIDWERLTDRGWRAASEEGSAKGGPIRLRRSLLQKLPVQGTPGPDARRR